MTNRDEEAACLVQAIHAAHEVVLDPQRRTTEAIFRLGDLLMEAKRRAGNGNWEKFELPFDHDTAVVPQLGGFVAQTSKKS